MQLFESISSLLMSITVSDDQNLLHNKKQKLSHIFNVELGESSKAFGNLRVQWQVNAARDEEINMNTNLKITVN